MVASLTSAALAAALGPGSPAFRRLFPELIALWRRVEDAPEAAVRYQQWQHCWSMAGGAAAGGAELFVRHTYLCLVARLSVRRFLQPGAPPDTPEDLAATVYGGYFREQGIVNFIEDDFFTWPLLPGAADDGIDLVRRLSHALADYDFSQAQPGVLQGLCHELAGPQGQEFEDRGTPPWLAEHILDDQLGLSRNPELSVFDPACGSGTFLFTAVRLIVAARRQRGEDSFDTLLHVLEQVMGVDVHPVAVTIARTNYLLALGELVRGPHPPVLLPVYLSNALVPPGSTAQAEPLGGYPEVVHTVYTGQPGLVFELPHSVASSPEMLDWLFFRLNQYLDGAQQRHRFQPREEAIQAVLAAFHNYLVSPKVRTPIPEPLTAFAAEVMERTARRVIELCLDCQDHLWLFILKNLPASVYLAQRKFDLVVGNQMGLAGDFLACCAGLYVKDAGWVAAVMAKETGAQLARPMGSFTLERVLDLEGVSPPFNVPARVLMARKVNPLTASQPPFIKDGPGGIPVNATTYSVPGVVFRGNVPSRNASWAEAQPALDWREARFHWQDGKLVPEEEGK